MAVREPDVILRRAEEALRRRFPNAEDIRAIVAPSGRVHLRIVDSAFNPLTERQKQDLLWHKLGESLDESEIKRISIGLAYGTDEYYDKDEL